MTAACSSAGRLELKQQRPAQNDRLIMARIVQKFGGTSVADLDRIRAVAQRVKAEVDAGNQVAVVVSAMSGTTNQLVEWATDIGPVHDAREYDVIVATGEQVTVGLLAIALQNIEVDARSWLGWQSLYRLTTFTVLRGLRVLT